MPVPVILDGAQGAGAVPVDVKALGCVAYAAAGQKWLCGADGTGLLYVAPGVRRARAHDRARPTGRSRTPRGAWTSTLRAGGAPLRPPLSREALAFSLAALEVLEADGLRRDLRARRRPRRRASPPRWPRPGPPSPRAGAPRSSPSSTRTPRPRASGSPRRASPSATCPGTPYLRASVGAWNDESDLERLLAALSERRLRLLRLELRRRPGLRARRREELARRARRRGSASSTAARQSA